MFLSRDASPDGRRHPGRALRLLNLAVVFSANNFAMQHKRKTISGNDVLEAMAEMDFERFVDPLQQALDGRGRRDAMGGGGTIVMCWGGGSVPTVWIHQWVCCV